MPKSTAIAGSTPAQPVASSAARAESSGKPIAITCASIACFASAVAGAACASGGGGDAAAAAPLAPLAPLLSAAVLLGDADDSSSVGASSSPRSSIASCSATPLSAGETVLAPGSAPGSGSSSAAGAEPRAAYERTPPSLLSSLCISAAADGLM